MASGKGWMVSAFRYFWNVSNEVGVGGAVVHCCLVSRPFSSQGNGPPSGSPGLNSKWNSFGARVAIFFSCLFELGVVNLPAAITKWRPIVLLQFKARSQQVLVYDLTQLLSRYSRLLEWYLPRIHVENDQPLQPATMILQSGEMKCNPDMDESAVLAGRGCATVSPISGLRFISPPSRFPRNAFQLETIHSADRALMTSSISIKSTRLWTTCVKGSVLLCPCVGRFSSQVRSISKLFYPCTPQAPDISLSHHTVPELYRTNHRSGNLQGFLARM